MKNPFSWLFRQVFGLKKGPVVQAEVNQVVQPLAVAALSRAGLPTTVNGAQQAVAAYALGKLPLSGEELTLLLSLSKQALGK